MKWPALIRLAIYSSICVLLGVFLMLTQQIRKDLQDLEVSASENMQWTLSQVEAEISKFETKVHEQNAPANFFSPSLLLRFEIWLSRANLIQTGLLSEVILSAPEGDLLLKDLAANNVIIDTQILNQRPVTPELLDRLKAITREQAKIARRISLDGAYVVGQNRKANREALATEVESVGYVALGMIIALSMALLALDVLLQRGFRTQRRVETNNRLIRQTIAASLDAIIVSDADGTILNFNPSAERMFGHSAKSAIGTHILRLISPPDNSSLSQSLYLELFKRGESRSEWTIIDNTGTHIPVAINTSWAETPEGEVCITFLQDISARKQQERTLIEAKERAEQEAAARSRFLAVMTHEMRTPLHGVLSVFDLLRDTPMNKQQSDYLEVATKAAETLLQHVSEALDLSAIESGTMTLSPEPVDLHSMASSAEDLLRPLADAKALDLRCEVNAAPDYFVKADPLRLRQLITNLANNAIKFTQDGFVKVSITCPPYAPGQQASIHLSVTDTGPGIPDAFRARMFESFVKHYDESAMASSGTGLGLAIAKQIASLMGGDLVHRNLPEGGSEFSCDLLLDVIEAPAPEPDPDLQARHQHPANQLSILVVEDHATNRGLLREMIVREGHQVFEATNGLEAVEMATQRVYDLILMDISMPRMNGLDATRQIRTGDGLNVETHIAGLSAHDVEEMRLEARRAGMSQFLTKPLRRKDLRALLAGMTASGGSPHIDLSSATPVLDYEHLSELADSLGVEGLSNAYARFANEFSYAYPALRASDDRKEMHDQLHKLKGAAAMLGMAQLAAEIDSVLRDIPNTDISNTKANLPKLRHICDRTLAALRHDGLME